MITNNYIIYSAKILSELLWNILYFPLWWYSKGFWQLLIRLKNFLARKQKSLALLVWIKNINKPMYGQYDWAGILISFLVRSFQIIIRSLIMVFWLIFSLAIFLFWLILPPLVVYEIIFQIIL